MPPISRFFAALLALAALAAHAAPVVKTDEVSAELVAHAPDGIQPGQPFWLGLRIDHAPHWHTYWKNPGDSGLPTTLAWTLPPGFDTGEIAWPTPKKLPIGPLVNHGYEGRLLLPVQVQVPASFSGDAVDVKLHAEWLVCKEVCIPQSGDFDLRLPVRASISTAAADFDAARKLAPRDSAAKVEAELVDGQLALRISGLPAGWQGQALDFFPELNGVLDHAAKPDARWLGADWVARLPWSPMRSESPARMDAVLVVPGEAAGQRVSFDVKGTWPAPGSEPPPAAPAVAAPVAQDASMGLGAALLFALVGGALLNLMPCVFPVLSLKVLGFASHAHERRQLLAGGVAYTVGVVASFVALAALLLALRAGGEQLGWGFQLQSPGFVAALAVLFSLIGLNLAGVFEAGSVLPSSVATLRARHPVADSALTGVLAVAVASPCTAPLMGAALGYAATLPAAKALSVFAALGAGMALPYLAASAWPGLARALPRPGPWMAHFKALMAFPMFATVVWLVWVLGQQAGIDGAAALLGLIVALAFVAWALGSPGLGRRARVGFGALSLALAAATLAWALPALHEAPAPSQQAGAAGWEPWSAARVAALQAEGRPVFVDFTAAWCVTCQFNKRGVLSDDAVLAGFAERRVALLRADWTRRDAAIGTELTRLGRSGVPVYALYAPGAAQPELLPEILSAQRVRESLSRLPAASPPSP